MAAAVQQRVWVKPYKHNGNYFPSPKINKTGKNIIVNRLIVAFTSFFILSFFVYYHTVVIEKSLNDKQNIIIKIQEQNCVLRNNLSQLQALPFIDQHSTDKLEMTTPSEVTYLTVPGVVLNASVKISSNPKPFKFSITTPIGY